MIDRGLISSYSGINISLLSPMMQQYVSIKESHKEYILLFRMGDFYEIFFEDAVIASSALGVVLTKRVAGGGFEVSMCGIPVHSYDSYMHRLIKRGYNVAICDQMETPEEAKKRGYKSLVKREVVRIVTPGTITEESLLDSDYYNYLLAVYFEKKKVGVAWIDVSSGDFYTDSLLLENLASFLYKVYPKEILVVEDFDLELLPEDFRILVTLIPREKFNRNNCLAALEKLFGSSHVISELSDVEKISCSVLTHYIELTHNNEVTISPPKKDYDSRYLRIDVFTRRSLELLSAYNGGVDGSLKSAINFTMTSQGARTLGTWINAPLRSISDINARLDVVNFFVDNQIILEKIRSILKNIPDSQRALGRILAKKASVLEVGILRSFLRNIISIRQVFFRKDIPEYLDSLIQDLNYYNDLLNLLEDSIIEDISHHVKDSGFLKKGSFPSLDKAELAKDDLLSKVLHLQEKYIVLLGISSIKISYTSTSGYSIEVPSKQASKILDNSLFKHKQTMTNVVRYTTEELMFLEKDIANCSTIFTSLQKQILEDIFQNIIAQKDSLMISLNALSAIDVLASFGYLAINNNFVRPIVDSSNAFSIIAGRHIVVEKSIKKNKDAVFVPNDCNMMDNKNIFVVTGPNMSGKSTFLRQNAIFIILAQAGCFIPASYAHIGVCDAIFSRVGASDDLFKGQSTFMVEMLELATILNYATDKSFIILDEIGRGTSTYDGLSIAWSSLEYINNKLNSRTLFATHYHELIDLEDVLDKVECYFVSVEEDMGKISFMHLVKKGAVSKSYGVDVAKIAGLPSSVTRRAKVILEKLESKEKTQSLPLFDFNYHNTIITQEEENEYKHYIHLIEDIRNLDIDSLSPKEALDKLYELQGGIKKK